MYYEMINELLGKHKHRIFIWFLFLYNSFFISGFNINIYCIRCWFLCIYV